MKIFLPLGLVVFFFYGCDCFCSNNTINPAFIGFSKSQIGTVILKRFTPKQNYANLIDSVVIIDQTLDTNCCHPFRYSVQGDTTIIFDHYDTIAPIRAGYDWQIFIPATGSTINISNIESGTQKNCKYCPPNIVSFVQNGVLVNSPFRINDFTTMVAFFTPVIFNNSLVKAFVLLFNAEVFCNNNTCSLLKPRSLSLIN